jgi:hypothetical protein
MLRQGLIFETVSWKRRATPGPYSQFWPFAYVPLRGKERGDVWVGPAVQRTTLGLFYYETRRRPTGAN